MAITTSFETVKKEFNPRYWDSIDHFEQYFLQRISETMADTNYYTDRNGVETQIPPVNHHPELKEYEVWVEGYSATGESAPYHLVGKAKARNFAQACDIVMCKKHLEWIELVNKPNYPAYCPPSKWSYDPSKLSDWGCRLFWSEELASRK